MYISFALGLIAKCSITKMHSVIRASVLYMKSQCPNDILKSIKNNFSQKIGLNWPTFHGNDHMEKGYQYQLETLTFVYVR